MRIETLRAFLKVLETRNFTVAADELFMTQSALSKQMSELEKTVGQQLLHRTTRSVHATAAGNAFKAHALRILEEWNLLTQEMSIFQQQTKQKIRIGYTASKQLPFLLAGINRKEWKKRALQIEFCRENPGHIITALRNGSIDCAVMHRPTLVPKEGMRADCLARASIHALVSNGSHLAHRSAITLSDVSHETDVRCKHSCDPFYYDAIDASFVGAELTPPKHIETGESEEVEILASHTGCMSLCPSIYPVWKNFVSVPISDCKADFDFLFVRNDSNLNPELDFLFGVIRAAMQNNL